MQKVAKVSLHHFSVVTEHEFDQCSYIRFVNDNGMIHCSFLMELNSLLMKSRVPSKKLVSIPELEVTAAVLSLKVICLLQKELQTVVSRKDFGLTTK